MPASSELQRFLGPVVGFGLVLVHAGCSFPERTFIEDSQFYGQGGTGNVPIGGTAGSSAGGTAGSGAGGTGVGATGGTGVGATGGTSTGNENCTNGADDDNDQKIDCEDSDCQPVFGCAPTVPSGWTGPVVMYEGASPAPECSASGGFTALKQNASGGINAPPATCPTCSCDPPSAATCGVNMEFWHDNTCSSSGCWGCNATQGLLTVDGTGVCKNINLTWGPAPGNEKPNSVWYKSAGSCPPKTTGTVTKPTIKFDKTVRLCGDAIAGQGCAAGTCVPKGASPFLGSACIYKTGDETCPGAYPQKTLHYLDTIGELKDDRTCAACACGTATGGACTGTVNVYSAPNCTGNATNLSGPSTCGSVTPGSASPSNLSAKYTAQSSGSGTCSPTGGQPSGAVTGTKPLTVCCL